MELGLIGLGKMGGNMRERVCATPATPSSATTATPTSPTSTACEELVEHAAGPARRCG